MIKILKSGYGLKKGQVFDKLEVDGQKAVLKSKRRIAFLPLKLLNELTFKHEEENSYSM